MAVSGLPRPAWITAKTVSVKGDFPPWIGIQEYEDHTSTARFEHADSHLSADLSAARFYADVKTVAQAVLGDDLFCVFLGETKRVLLLR
jgi:hypothetical protein